MTLQLSQVIQRLSTNEMFQLTDLFAFFSSDLICIAAQVQQCFWLCFFSVLILQPASGGTENSKHVAADVLLEENAAGVLWSRESYKMLASTSGQSRVDARSSSLFVKGEISISDAKGQLLLAAPPSLCVLGAEICQGGVEARVLYPSAGAGSCLTALSVAMRPDRCKNPQWVLQLLRGFAWIWSTSAPIMHHCRGPSPSSRIQSFSLCSCFTALKYNRL